MKQSAVIVAGDLNYPSGAGICPPRDRVLADHKWDLAVWTNANAEGELQHAASVATAGTSSQTTFAAAGRYGEVPAAPGRSGFSSMGG